MSPYAAMRAGRTCCQAPSASRSRLEPGLTATTRRSSGASTGRSSSCLRSISATSRPVRASANAAAAPTVPPPMTSVSKISLSGIGFPVYVPGSDIRECEPQIMQITGSQNQKQVTTKSTKNTKVVEAKSTAGHHEGHEGHEGEQRKIKSEKPGTKDTQMARSFGRVDKRQRIHHSDRKRWMRCRLSTLRET